MHFFDGQFFNKNHKRNDDNDVAKNEMDRNRTTFLIHSRNDFERGTRSWKFRKLKQDFRKMVPLKVNKLRNKCNTVKRMETSKISSLQ